MRAAKDALRYAILGSLQPSQDQHWRANDLDARAMTDEAFETHVAALCATAQNIRASDSTHDGSRTRQRLKERVTAREKKATHRTALDLQRLADLEDRIGLRHAEAARQRWFVLGRLLAQASDDDPHWARVVETLLTRRSLTAQEKRALDRGKARQS